MSISEPSISNVSPRPIFAIDYGLAYAHVTQDGESATEIKGGLEKTLSEVIPEHSDVYLEKGFSPYSQSTRLGILKLCALKDIRLFCCSTKATARRRIALGLAEPVEGKRGSGLAQKNVCTWIDKKGKIHKSLTRLGDAVDACIIFYLISTKTHFEFAKVRKPLLDRKLFKSEYDHERGPDMSRNTIRRETLKYLPPINELVEEEKLLFCEQKGKKDVWKYSPSLTEPFVEAIKKTRTRREFDCLMGLHAVRLGSFYSSRFNRRWYHRKDKLTLSKARWACRLMRRRILNKGNDWSGQITSPSFNGCGQTESRPIILPKPIDYVKPLW